MFLGEMEELIDALQPSDFVKLLTSILHQLSKCVENEHFQVGKASLNLALRGVEHKDARRNPSHCADDGLGRYTRLRTGRLIQTHYYSIGSGASLVFLGQ